MKPLIIVPITCLMLTGVLSSAIAQPDFATDPPWVDPPRRVDTEPPHASNLATLNEKDPNSAKVTAIVEIRTNEPERLLRLATPAVEAVGGTAGLVQWANWENADDLALEVIADEDRMLDLIATVQSLDREAARANADGSQAMATPQASSVPEVHFFEGSATEMAQLRPILPEPIEPAQGIDQVEVIYSNFSSNHQYSAPPEAERLITPTATYRI